MYQFGRGVTKDSKEALRWFRKAAKQGNAWAQVLLANLEKQLRAEGNRPPRSHQAKANPAFTPDYDAGKAAIKRRDYATARRHFRPLAEQGHADAQNSLGWVYQYGQGVTRDYKEAARWYRLAAKQGDAEAQARLGVMYEYGRGVTKDDAEAVRWYRKAAEQGDANAQYQLGRMYRYGQGVTYDYTEAGRWYRKAANQGHARARSRLASLEKHLRREGNRPRSRQASKPPAPSASKQQKELERLRREIARLKKEKQAKPRKVFYSGVDTS